MRQVYLRGHGPDGRCKDHYSDRILRAWARYTGKWRHERRSVFVYFDNDQKSAAPTDARRFGRDIAAGRALIAVSAFSGHESRGP